MAALKIFGHRGAAGLVFENTLDSIQKAIDLGVDYIEIDVWKTTDDQVEVFHDFSLERLTSETGFIAEKTHDFLQQISLRNGAKIPDLKQVVALIKPHKIPLVVEVKDENAFDLIMKILTRELALNQFVIGSFYHQKISDLKQQHTNLQTAIMFEGVPVDLPGYLQAVNPDYVVTAIETVNQHLAETVKQQNRKLVFYTVNSAAEFARAQRFEPYGIVTNFPDRFL